MAFQHRADARRDLLRGARRAGCDRPSGAGVSAGRRAGQFRGGLGAVGAACGHGGTQVGAPFQPELGVGAIAEGGERLLDDRSLRMLGLARPLSRSTAWAAASTALSRA